MPTSESIQLQNPVEHYFLDQRVKVAIMDSSWYTTDYIKNVREDHQPLLRDKKGALADPALQEYIDFSDYNRGETGQLYRGVLNYLLQNITSNQGHVFPLKEIRFCDQKILEMVNALGLGDNYQFSRSMFSNIQIFLDSIIAPEEIRNAVIKLSHDWGDPSINSGATKVMNDVLIMSQLVRKGSSKYIEQMA